ncbi:hypothetical protein [Nocardia sp. NPDC002869]|uniref:hypothetical protein n=1 Tax=Nocardia sp. NPDC002869 TaxID=3161032 RepID=UPI00398D2186
MRRRQRPHARARDDPARPVGTDDLISDPFADGLSAAFTFALVCCVLGAIFSFFTDGRGKEAAAEEKTHEPVGDEPAAVAAFASGEAPSELIDEPVRR